MAEDGPFALFCDFRTEQRGVMTFWIYVYWLSKFPELLDTAILVLRKKNVIFLHVFHHAIMCLMPWLWLRGNWTVVWFGCWLNCAIHVFMYGYFAGAAAVGYQPWWKKYLTMA
jgi:fatty acid elongase 3